MFVLAHALYLREKARELRIKKQFTIDELAERLALSRSTIYYWVRDLPIPASDRTLERRSAARQRAVRANKARYRALREEAYEEGLATFPQLIAEPTFRDFICLYIAEGSKRSRNSVAICNSDPSVMKVGDRWIRRLARNTIDYRIQYHADQNLEELVTFWGAELKIDPALIGLQRKSNSNGLTGRMWRSKYGVLTIRAADTYLRARLEAWMDCVRQSWV